MNAHTEKSLKRNWRLPISLLSCFSFHGKFLWLKESYSYCSYKSGLQLHLQQNFGCRNTTDQRLTQQSLRLLQYYSFLKYLLKITTYIPNASSCHTLSSLTPGVIPYLLCFQAEVTSIKAKSSTVYRSSVFYGTEIWTLDFTRFTSIPLSTARNIAICSKLRTIGKLLGEGK